MEKAKDEEEEGGGKTPCSPLSAVMSLSSNHDLTSVSRNTCSELAY